MTIKIKKVEYMVDVAANALACVLRGLEQTHPEEYTVKARLIPMVASRASRWMEENYTLDHDLQAIPAPDEKFIHNHWSRICKTSARKHKVYPVWDAGFVRGGFRKGTLEEYQSNQYTLKRINTGIGDSIGDRSNIIVEHGGISFRLEITEIAQLPSGL